LNKRRPNVKIHRLGETKLNNYGSRMTIIEYTQCNDIMVQFEKGEPIHTTWHHFKNGKVKSPYDRTVYGIGYLGEGVYNVSENKKSIPRYKTWQSMLSRCYVNAYQEKHPSYVGCRVDERWYNYQLFSQWYDENYYEVEGENMQLDKDILIKGNKIYSPETCVFVPQTINSLFLKHQSVRGELPIGVINHRNGNGKYRVACSNPYTGQKYIGKYDTIEEAFYAYKVHKEQVIKLVANNHKDKIPVNLYNVMMGYEVEIND
jgi:hypothetical protein